MTAALDDVFAALADGTRRQVLRRLVAEGPTTATVLARDLPITRQAVVKHLQSLHQAGLVAPERHGREVRYVASARPLEDAAGWLADTGVRWDRRLERLRQHVVRG